MSEERLRPVGGSTGFGDSGSEVRIWDDLIEGDVALVWWNQIKGYDVGKQKVWIWVFRLNFWNQRFQEMRDSLQCKSFVNLCWSLFGKFGLILGDQEGFHYLSEGLRNGDLEIYERQLCSLSKRDHRQYFQWIIQKIQGFSFKLLHRIGERLERSFRERKIRFGRFLVHVMVSDLFVVCDINKVKDEIALEIWSWSEGFVVHMDYFGQVEFSIVPLDLAGYVDDLLWWCFWFWKVGNSQLNVWEMIDISWIWWIWLVMMIDEVGKRKDFWLVLIFKGELGGFFNSCWFLAQVLSLSQISYYSKFFLGNWFTEGKVTMSQSYLLENGMVVESPKRLKIMLPRFDNSEIIKGYAKTLIGRCMNPNRQDMQSLLFMMPKIWKVEGRVVGADLGRGRFQFNFEAEEDIQEVLKMEPFHFDYWMVALVRWEPSMDRNYPSLIRFWVWVVDLPMQWWAEPTFRTIGKGLGMVEQDGIDLIHGRLRVWVDGCKPLILEIDMSVYTGEQTIVTLRYEKLYGFCRRCNRLCHDTEICPLNRKLKQGEVRNKVDFRVTSNRGMKSYKGAVEYGNREGISELKREGGRYMTGRGTGMAYRGKSGVFNWSRKVPSSFGDMSEENKEGAASTELQEVYAAVPSGSNALKLPTSDELPDPTRIMLEAFHGKALDGFPNQRESAGIEVEEEKGGGGSRVQEESLLMEIHGNAKEEIGVFKGGEDEKMGEEGMKEQFIEDWHSPEITSSLEKLDEEWLDNMSDVEKEFDEKELLGVEDGEGFVRNGIDKDMKPKSAKKKLFQNSGVGFGGTATKLLVQTMVSPRKGVQGKGKGKEGKGKEGKGGTEANRKRVGSEKNNQTHEFV